MAAAATNPVKVTPPPVPTRYTWKQVAGYVRALRDKKTSLRGIAHLLNQRAGAGQVVITHRTVQRILAGKRPHDRRIRAALHLYDPRTRPTWRDVRAAYLAGALAAMTR